MYERRLGDISYLIVCSFMPIPVKVRFPRGFEGREGELVLSNYREGRHKAVIPEERVSFKPYECRVYRVRK